MTESSSSTIDINHKPDEIKVESKQENKEKKKFVKLKGKIKKFDQELYDKYDQPARAIMKEKFGDLIKDNPEIYDEDMILDIPGSKYKYVELQVCAEWITDIYPHKTPFVFERKGHFSDKTLYIIFNKYMTKGLLFAKTSLEKKPRRYRKYSKIFVYDVPWRHVVTFDLESLNMDLLELFGIF
jgi:hypothetical protein